MQFAKASLLAAVMTISIHSASATISTQDIASPAGSGSPTGPACIPACRVHVEELGCIGSADFIGACNQRTGDDTLDLGGEGCDGFTVEWSVSGDDANGAGVIFVNAPTGVIGVDVHDCKVPQAIGQCVYEGGCTVDN
ncbi:hypothetical protein GE09DRAFT_1196322 [Coniochaeta sp. 2T2.1]|nr:hypothetical protein GE09DRAFT_1196322 [Coniochaeta sp. 2T2.1]